MRMFKIHEDIKFISFIVLCLAILPWVMALVIKDFDLAFTFFKI
jgi:hypothetical protein